MNEKSNYGVRSLNVNLSGTISAIMSKSEMALSGRIKINLGGLDYVALCLLSTIFEQVVKEIR